MVEVAEKRRKKRMGLLSGLSINWQYVKQCAHTRTLTKAFWQWQNIFLWCTTCKEARNRQTNKERNNLLSLQP